MIPVRGVKGARIGVLGLGRSGLTVAKALEAGGATALCWDDSEEARNAASDAGLTVHDLSKADAWIGMSRLVVSPGIPHLFPQPNRLVERAVGEGVALDNDIGLFFQSLATPEWDRFEVAPRVVAVTGSNGKSTVAALLHHCLQVAGRESQLAGNIGRGVFDIEPPSDGGVIVLELSSYQTELARSLTPDVAVFTNLSPDHLDRHGGFGGYFAAKRRLFSEGGPDRAIIGVDEPEGRFLANQISEANGDDRVIRVSVSSKLTGAGWSVYSRKGFLAEYRKSRQIASIDLREIVGLPGAHNHQNACSAYAALRTLGLAPKLIEQGLRSFEGLPHRSQTIATIGGVNFVNDSKATNVDSAAKALAAFSRIRWIVGGQMKEGDFQPLLEAAKNVVKAYVIGRQASETALSLGEIEKEVCGTMDVAVNSAAEDAEAGDTVLLAPAGASFDQYDNFEKRGEDFIRCVASLE